jgi:hypothetical protein
MNKKIIVIGLILLLTATVFSGCVDDKNTDDNKKTTDNDDNTAKTYTINTNYPRDHLGLNEDGEAAFTSACNRYSELKSSMTDEEARIALVNELNSGFDFVKEASLSEDGYTIAVIFEDDTAALMFTYRVLSPEDESVATGSQFSIYDTNTEPIKDSEYKDKITNIEAKETLLAPLASEIDTSNSCEVDFVVPQSKKVLIINALSLCELYLPSYQEEMVTTSFIENGWKSNDIDIKKRTSLNDGNLTPDDYFDYSSYGIIMYMGHGGYCSGYEGSIPGHHYLECCDIKVNYTSIVGQQRLEQYRTWRDQGRLIYGGYYTNRAETDWEWELYIDTDLIMEQAKIDPGTIVYVDSCNSDRAADAYLINDAGCFFGFDYKSDSKSSANAFYELINAMTNEGVPQNAAHALNQLSDEVRTCSGGGKLQLYDNGKDVYLPSFGKLVVQPSSPPSGTSYYELKFSPYGTTKTLKINAGEEIEYDGVSPVNTTINIRAKGSTGNIVETGIYKPELLSGENELFTITAYNTYGIILDADPTTVEPDGTSTSTINATLKTFLEDDVTKPTGIPLSCKEVEFITNFGSFVGSSKVMTDENGQATIELVSDKNGIATVRAIVENDGMESYKTQNITFGEVPYSFRLAERRTQQADSSGDIIEVMAWGYYLVFKGKEGVDHYIITRNCTDYEKEYSTTGELPYEDDYYKDLRILTDEERTEWKIEYEGDGYRFFLFRGGPVSISETSDAWQTTLSEKQSYLYNSLNECIFTIEAYNS